MPVPEILGAATVMEEVAIAGETVESVDLATVSQQLDHIAALLSSLDFGQMVLVGALLGACIVLLLAVMFRG